MTTLKPLPTDFDIAPLTASPHQWAHNDAKSESGAYPAVHPVPLRCICSGNAEMYDHILHNSTHSRFFLYKTSTSPAFISFLKPHLSCLL